MKSILSPVVEQFSVFMAQVYETNGMLNILLQ